MLLQLMEPGQTPLPHEAQKAPAIGIDLGTTHSLVAIVEEGRPHILKDASGQSLLPSIIHRGAHSLSSFKRFMQPHPASTDGAAQSLPALTLGDQPITAIEASAEILKILKARAENYLGCAVTRAVITVPAYFDDGARTATRAAARLAGLDVLRLVNEPTAAALAYGLEHSRQGVYGVYDLGGGTFDFSLLRLEGLFFKVLATGGDTQLGGDDMDQLILSHFNLSAIPIEKKAETWRHARQAKEFLTDHQEWTGILLDDQSACRLTRITFNHLIDPLIRRTLLVCRQVMQDAECTLDQLQGLVLVGGATRIPFLRQQIQDFFQQDPLIDLNPDEIVALGAALQAHALSEGSAHLLLDVNPLSLGLETYGGLVEKIIPRNSPLPGRQSQEFTTFQDNQTAISFHVVQGERELVQDCRSLAHFELRNIPPLPAGQARVQVTFLVDADGILTVSAREKTTGQEQSIEVKPTFDLTEKTRQHMIAKSQEHAQEDEESKKTQAAKIEQERLTQLIHGLFSENDPSVSRESEPGLEP